MSLDDHLPRVTAESQTALQTTLDILDEHAIPYALIGGWAVFAHGSRIPSIDTDILLSTEAATQFRQVLQDRNLQHLEGPGKHIEILAMDEANDLHGFDWELEPVPAYTPSEILDGHLIKMPIKLSQETFTALTPTAARLAFMKLKAMHDRCFDYLAVTDPTFMARSNPSDRPLIAQKSSGHYRRKAGKDLADLAFLCTSCTDLDDVLATSPNLRPHLERALKQVPRPIYDYAMEMIRPHEAGEGWITENVATRGSHARSEVR